ncbi:hypothetical protein PCASD_08150 [Puccinia coronata f. sp. avenae]|uniref:Uncharacterized protein n=1 Tax=Puccinia coronata f. sp. avenae TaxID=200324 RepID=A0A2N5VAC8_9BASI|nr:hypothetical protein PCASD_08150 [Puccinia coronata f. sp. avenae]
MEVQSSSDGAVFVFDGRVLGSFDARLVEDRRRSRPATQARANLNPSRRSDRGDALQPSKVPGLIRAYSSKGQGLPTKQRPGPNQIKLRSALRHAQGDQDTDQTHVNATSTAAEYCGLHAAPQNPRKTQNPENLKNIRNFEKS